MQRKSKANGRQKVQNLSFFGMIRTGKKSAEDLMIELRSPRYRWDEKKKKVIRVRH